MNITLKSVKYAKFASEETPCFEALVLIDGKPLCHAHNDGHGGADFYDPVAGRSRKDIDDVDAALKTSAIRPDKLEPWEQELWDGGYRPGLEDAVGEALTDFLRRRDFKRLLGRKALGIHNGKLLQFKAKYSPAHAAAATKAYPGIVFLNALPFDEAYKAAVETGAF